MNRGVGVLSILLGAVGIIITENATDTVSTSFLIDPPSSWNYIEDPSVMLTRDGQIFVFGHGGLCCPAYGRERIFVWQLGPGKNQTAFMRDDEPAIHEIGFQSAVRVRGILGIDLFHSFVVRTLRETIGLQNRVRISHGVSGSAFGQWSWQDAIISPVNQDCATEGSCIGIGQHHPIAFWDGAFFNVMFIEHAGDPIRYRHVKLDSNLDVVDSLELNLNCPSIGICSPFSDGGLYNGMLTAVTSATFPDSWGRAIYVLSWNGSYWREIKRLQVNSGYVKGCSFFRNELGNIIDVNNFVCVYSETKDEIPGNYIFWRWIVISESGTPRITEQPNWSGLFASPTPTPTPRPTPTPTPPAERRPRQKLERAARVYPDVSEVVWFPVGIPTTLYVWTTNSDAVIRTCGRNILCPAWSDDIPCVIHLNTESNCATAVIGASTVLRVELGTSTAIWPSYVYAPIVCEGDGYNPFGSECQISYKY